MASNYAQIINKYKGGTSSNYKKATAGSYRNVIDKYRGSDRLKQIIEENKKKTEELRKEWDRKARNQELYQKAVQQSEQLKQEANRPLYKVARGSQKVIDASKAVGKFTLEEIAKPTIRGGAFLADLGERATPQSYLASKIREQASGLKAMRDIQPGESAYDAYRRGQNEFKARPLYYEKVSGYLDKDKDKDYKLPQLQGNNLDMLKQVWTSKEYRRPILDADEAVSNFVTAPLKFEAYIVSKFGESAIKKLPVLKRLITRTITHTPEAGIQTGIQLAREDEMSTSMGAGKTFLANTLIMSLFHNIGELKGIKLSRKELNKVADELEEASGVKLDTDDLIDIKETVEAGAKPEDIVKIAKEADKEKAGIKTEEIKTQEAITDAEKPVEPSLEEKGVEIPKEKKEGLKTITEPKETVKEAPRVEVVEPTKVEPKIETKEIIETNKKVSKVAKSIEQKMKDWGMIDKDASVDKATFESRNIKDQTKKVAKLISNEKELDDILTGKKELPKDTSGSMFIAGVENKIEKLTKTDPDKAFKIAEQITSFRLTGETGQHASELRLLQERNTDSVTARMQNVKELRIKKNKPYIKEAKRKIKKEINKIVKSQSWEDFIDNITCE